MLCDNEPVATMLQDPSPEDLQQMLNFDEPGVSTSSMLVVWVSEALFTVTRHPTKDSGSDEAKSDFKYGIIDEHGEELSDVDMEPEWRQRQGDQLSFIVMTILDKNVETGHDLGNVSHCMIRPMLIERAVRIASRVGISSRMISLEKWLDAQPTRQRIVLV